MKVAEINLELFKEDKVKTCQKNKNKFSIQRASLKDFKIKEK